MRLSFLSLLFIGSIACHHTVLYGEEKLIYHNAFDSVKELKSWPAKTPVELSKDQETGNACLTFSAANPMSVYFYLPLAENTKYRFSFKIRSDKQLDEKSFIFLRFNEKGGANGSAGEEKILITDIPADGKWHDFVATFAAPQGACACQYQFAFGRSNANIAIADLKIWQGENVEPAKVAVEIPAQYYENILENPGFEEVDKSGVPTHWKPWFAPSEAQLTTDTSATFAGQRAALVNSASPGRHFLVQTFKVIPDKTYEISAWVKTADYHKGEAALICDFGPANAKPRPYKSLTHMTGTRDWTHVVFYATAPHAATQATFCVVQSNGKMWIDDTKIIILNDKNEVEEGMPNGVEPVDVLENEFLRVSIAAAGGAVTGFYDKIAKNELAAGGANAGWSGIGKERLAKDLPLKTSYRITMSKDKGAPTALAEGALTADAMTEKRYTLVGSSLLVDLFVKGDLKTELSTHHLLPGLNIKTIDACYYLKGDEVVKFKKGGDFVLEGTANGLVAVIDRNGNGLLLHAPGAKQVNSYFDASVGSIQWGYGNLPGDTSHQFRTSYMLTAFNAKNISLLDSSVAAFAKKVAELHSKSDGESPESKVGKQALMPPLTTSTPALPPKKAGYYFASNIKGVAYAAAEMPSAIHFKPVNFNLQPELVLDLPEGVELLSGFRGFKISPPEMTTRNGAQYARYSIKPQSGASKFTFFWKTNLLPGVKLNGYYHAKWDNGTQVEQVLPIEVISIPPCRTFKEVPTWYCIPADMADIWPGLDHYKKAGFNTIDVWTYLHPKERAGGVKTIKSLMAKASQADVKMIAWIREWWWNAAINDPEAQATLKDGKKTKALCPSYRGKHFEMLCEQGRFMIDNALYFHSVDPEIYGGNAEAICFCEKCKNLFRQYLVKSNSSLPIDDPAQIVNSPDKYPEGLKMWRRFKGTAFARIFGDYRNQMEEYMKSKGINEKFKFMIYSTYHRNWDSFYGYDDYEQAPPFLKTMEDPKALAEVFDYISPMIYPDVYANYADYDMLCPWKDTVSLRKIVGGKAVIAPLLCPGYPFVEAFDCDNSPEMLKYNILESIAGGAKGFGFWGECPLDAADMKAVAETVNLLLPAEDIILNGHPYEDAPVSGEIFVKGVMCADKALVFISEYSRRPCEAVVKSPLSGGTVKIVDLETGKEMVLPAGKVEFPVSLHENRVKVFLVRRE